MTGFLLRFLRDIRLVPIVLIATAALFALKTLGLVLDAGYLFDHHAGSDASGKAEITGTVADASQAAGPSAATWPSWAKPMPRDGDRNDPVDLSSRSSDPDFTGAVGEPPGPPPGAAPPAPGQTPAKSAPEPVPAPIGTPVQLDEHPVSPAERAILESLQKRRAELDARAHDLDTREDLLKAAEKRVGGRIDELKELEARVNALLQQRDDAEQARFKNVVTMYEAMKAKDAAKIFDGLDMRVLIDVAKAINPRTMSEILAQMQPENAQRLTVELAVRPPPKDGTVQAADLPKIQGAPNPN